MDTVVEEKPLSFATSRMVTMIQTFKISTSQRWCGCRVASLRLYARSKQLDASLEFKRTLADTTAKSHASVKHTDHIDHICFGFCTSLHNAGIRPTEGLRRTCKTSGPGRDRPGADLCAGAGGAHAEPPARSGTGFPAGA